MFNAIVNNLLGKFYSNKLLHNDNDKLIVANSNIAIDLKQMARQ